jgi:hypothetical protein
MEFLLVKVALWREAVPAEPYRVCQVGLARRIPRRRLLQTLVSPFYDGLDPVVSRPNAANPRPIIVPQGLGPGLSPLSRLIGQNQESETSLQTLPWPSAHQQYSLVGDPRGLNPKTQPPQSQSQSQSQPQSQSQSQSQSHSQSQFQSTPFKDMKIHEFPPSAGPHRHARPRREPQMKRRGECLQCGLFWPLPARGLPIPPPSPSFDPPSNAKSMSRREAPQ